MPSNAALYLAGMIRPNGLSPRSSSGPQGTDDHGIVARVRNGDLDAFESVFRTHYSELVRFAYATVQSSDVAQDLVSELFSSLFERRATWEIRTSIRAYLMSATRYRVINYIRDTGRERKRHQSMILSAHDDETATTAPPSDLVIEALEQQTSQLSALDRAIDDLSPRSRLVVTLRWRQQLSFDEIAEIMETTSAAVQMQLSRAMKVLRERLPTCLK